MEDPCHEAGARASDATTAVVWPSRVITTSLAVMQSGTDGVVYAPMSSRPGDSAEWRSEVEQMLAEADRYVRPEERATRLTDVGDLYRDRAGSPAQASEYYFQAVAVHPDAPQHALSRLAQLARDTGDVGVTANLVAGLSHAGQWEDVVTVLVRQSEATTGPEERVGLLLEAARTCLVRLGDRVRARRHLLSAARDTPASTRDDVLDRLRAYLDEHPADDDAARVAARLETDAGRPLAGVGVLTRCAATHTVTATKASLFFDAAILCADRAARPTDACAHLYEARVLDAELAEQVEARMDDVVTRWGHVAEVLDQAGAIYERLGQPERVHAIRARQLEAVSGEERARRLLALAEHAEYQLVDPGRAFELYRLGLHEGHGQLAAFAAGMRRVGAEGVPGAVAAMTDLFGRLGLWRALACVYDDEAALAVEDEERADLLHRAGEVLENHLEDLEGATKRYLKAFKLRPRDARHLAAGERVYRRRGDWKMVDRLLGLQLQVAGDPGVSARLLVEQGRLRHRKLGAHLGAYDSTRAALGHDPEGAFGALRDLVAGDEAFAVIERGLRKRAAEEGATEASRILLELAALHLDIRGRVDLAVAAVREACDLSPADAELFARVGELHEANDDEAGLARWLAGAGHRPLPRAVRIGALRRAGELLGGQGELVAARDAWRGALRLQPGDAELLTGALDAARASDDPAAVGALLEEALAGRIGGEPPDAGQRLIWLRELAESRVGLGEVAGAAEAYRSLLAEAPLDEGALSFLRRWHEKRGAWESLRSLLETAADARREAAGEADLALVLELAELAEERLGDPRLASVYLRSLLEHPRADGDLRAKLRRLYEQAGDREGEVGLLELELDAAGDDDARRVTAERLVELASAVPRDEAAAVRGLRVLAALTDDVPQILDRLAEALRRRPGETSELAEVLGRRWQKAPAAAHTDVLRERAALLIAAGELDEAASAWRAVLAHGGDDVDRAALQAVEEARGDHEAVFALLWDRQRDAAGDAERLTLLREAAVVAEVRLGDDARAVSAWEAARGIDAAALEATGELVRLHEAAEHWSELLSVGRARLPMLDPPDRVELARRLAGIATDTLEDEAAADALWAVVLETDPRDAEGLERSLVKAEADEDHDLTATLLGRLAEDAPTAARRALLVRRARALEAACDLPGAIAAWEAVCEVGPPAREPHTAMRELALRRKDHWTAARALASELPFVTDPDERVALDRVLGRISDEELGDQIGAVAAWERVLAAAPDDYDALCALKGLYADLGRTDDLVRTMRRLLEGADDPESRVRLLIDAAGQIETQRGDYSEAFECWWRALQLETRAPPHMVSELRRLAEAGEGLWPRFVEALRFARTRAGSPLARVELWMQEAEVNEIRLDDAEAAFEAVMSAFALMPREGRALEALERLAPAAGRWADYVGALRTVADGGAERPRRAVLLTRAAEVSEVELGQPETAFELFAVAGAQEELLRLAAEHDLWRRLVEVYQRRWQAQSQVRAQIATLHELAELLEARAADWELAFEQYLMALQLDPRDEETRGHVWRLADAHDAWAVVARVFELKAPATEEPWQQIALLHDLAELQLDRLGLGRRALETLKKAFAIEPWNEKTHAALRRVADAVGAWRELAAFLEEEARWAQEHHARIRLYRAAIEVLKDHGETAEAARLVKRLAELAPGDDEAADEELDLLRAADDHAELAAALERHARGTDEERRARLLAELAELYHGPLELPVKAGAVYQRLLVLRPGDPSVFDGLVASLEGRGAWEELAQALEQRIPQAEGEVRHGLQRRRAMVLRSHLDRSSDAFRLLARIARDRPDDLELLFDLASWVDEAGEHQELLACAERSTAVADPDRLPEVLLLVGRTARDAFGNEKKARQALGRALELRPDDLQLAQEVAALLGARGLWAELVELQRRYGPSLVVAQGESPTDDAVRARWGLGLAELQAERLFKLDDAVATLRDLSQRQPDDIPVLRALRSLSKRAQDPGVLLISTLQLVGLLTDEEERVDALARGARDIAALGDAEGAVSLWKALLEVRPGHPEALHTIGRFAEKRRDWDLLAEQLEARAGAADAMPQRAKILCELGKLQREQRGDAAAASAVYESALRASPGHLVALAALVDLARDRGDVPRALDLVAELADAIDHTDDRAAAKRLTPEVAELQRWRAEVAAGRCEDERALACLLDAHDRAPERTDIGQSLADALYAKGDLRAAAAIYSGLPPRGTEDEAEKAAEHLRRARAFCAVGQADSALREFEAASQFGGTRAEALSSLANLHEAGGRWEAAVRLREKLATACDAAETRAAALVAAGAIVETRLGHAARAVTYYERALDDGLDDAVLLRRIFGLLCEHGNGDRALAIAERLVVEEVDANQRAELWCSIGRLHAQAERDDRAADAFRRALDLSPLMAEAGRGLLVALRGDEEARASAARLVFEGLQGVTGKAKAPVLEILGEHLRAVGDRGAALEVYEALNALDAGHLGARAALACLYEALEPDERDADHFRRAISHRLAFLRGCPGDPDGLRHLAQLYEAAGYETAAAAPLRLLALVKSASRSETERARSLTAAPADASPGQVPLPELSGAAREELVADAGLRQPIGRLMEALHALVADELDELFRAARAQAGEPADVVHPPLVELGDALARVLDVPARRLWLTTADDRSVSLARLHPPELVAGGALAHGLFAPERRFLLARALELTRGPHVYAAYVPQGESAALFAAAMALALPAQGPEYALSTAADPERIEYWAEFLHSRADEAAVSTLAQYARPVLASGPGAFAEWALAVRRTANRIGFVMSGDLARSIALLQREDPAAQGRRISGPAAFRELVATSEPVGDLYRFAFGPSYLDLTLAATSR